MQQVLQIKKIWFDAFPVLKKGVQVDNLTKIYFLSMRLKEYKLNFDVQNTNCDLKFKQSDKINCRINIDIK